VEQHVHNIDVVNWAFKDVQPVKVYGMGGRQARTAPEYGNIYDHFCIEFEYPGAVLTHSMCRQMPKTTGRVSERIVGTKGWTPGSGMIFDHKGEKLWSYEGPAPKPYVQEHTDLIKSIRAGEPLNEAKRVAESTMCAIMGRISAYTGRMFSTAWAMEKCSLNLVPENLDIKGSKPVAEVSQPGRTKLVGAESSKKGGRKRKKK
jgi:predicted dehydrogenase